ncbi:SHOCT domain-containing protein [Halosimplex aquaticum]
MDATSDENTVLFDKESLSEFEELRAKVRELKNGDVEESTGSMDEAMEKLRTRYAEGEIDEEEYEQRKDILQKDG